MNKEGRKKIKLSTICIYIACILVAAIMLIPFVWMLSASFKAKNEIFTTPIKWIPEVFRTVDRKSVV